MCSYFFTPFIDTKFREESANTLPLLLLSKFNFNSRVRKYIVYIFHSIYVILKLGKAFEGENFISP
jgi:hypothetical protein